MTRPLIIALSFLLSGCVSADRTPESYLISQDIKPPTENSFQHCYNYGCARVVDVYLMPDEWNSINQIFETKSNTATQEREKIAMAIGTFEIIVGEKTGTSADKFGTFRNMGNFHHDCIDESTNTTTYLILLKNKKLLQFHDVSAPDSRVPLLHGGKWPHRTAVVTEKSGQKQYAIDSWFHDNGFPAEVVSMPDWKKGWKPEKNFTWGSDSGDHK